MSGNNAIASALAIFSILVLSACGGGSGDDDGDDGSGSGDTSDPGTGNVSPSLGLVQNATVNFYKADNTTLIDTVDLGESGSANFDLDGYTGPVVIEVQGDADATYYDESTLTDLPFPAGQSLHALIPEPTGDITATLLTDLPYQIVDSENLWPITPRVVRTLNALVKQALAPELPKDITTPPKLFDGSTTSGSLRDNHAGRYAAKLAAFSILAEGEGSPSLHILDEMRAGVSGGDYSGAQFPFHLDNRLRGIAGSYGTDELEDSVAAFGFVSGRLNRGILELGTGAEGATVSIAPFGVLPAYDVDVTGPDSNGYMLLESSSEAGNSRVRFPDEPGTYTCSSNNSGTSMEMQFPNNPWFVTSHSEGDCTLVVLQANDNAVEGFASGTIVNPGFPQDPYEFTDGYFYVEIN